MNKFALVLLAIILLSSFSMKISDDSANTEWDSNGAGKINSYLLIFCFLS